MHVCIFEDIRYRSFLPLTYFRPLYELRCGTRSLREKIETCFGPAARGGRGAGRARVCVQARGEVAECYRDEYRELPVNTIPDRDTWFINGRTVADDALTKLVRRKPRDSRAYIADGEVLAAYVEARKVRSIARSWTEPLSSRNFEEIVSERIEGTLVRYPWDLVNRTAEEIEKDFRERRRKPPAGTMLRGARARVYRGAHLVNKKNILLGAGSVVKPGAVLDGEHGPVILARGVTVMPNAVIEGPAFIGDHSTIKAGAKIYHGTSIGAHCKIGGEVEASIIQSHSNKQHEGFLGHSYLGSWVNIGADTNSSDLKNTYGTVRVLLGGEEIDTGLQFVGLTMGDHSKTGINVMFDTGTIVGLSCNIFGPGLLPKFIPSFSWGENNALTVYDLEKSLETARRMMARRNVRMSGAYESLFRQTFSMTEDDRRKAGIA